jgi:hypothetical protein
MDVNIVDTHALYNTTLVKTSRRQEKAPVTVDPVEEDGRYVSPDTDVVAAVKALKAYTPEPSTVVNHDTIKGGRILRDRLE